MSAPDLVEAVGSDGGRRRGRASIALGLTILFAALALTILSERPAPNEESPRSFAKTGRRAAHDLLAALDFDVRFWEGLPRDLPRGDAVLFVHALPGAPGEPGDNKGKAGSRSARDPAHYRRFVEEGGVLVVAYDEALQEFVEGTLGIEEAAELERFEIGAQVVRATVDSGRSLGAGATEIDLAWLGAHWFEPPDPRLGARALVVTEEAQVLALRFERGRGAVVLLADATWLANEHLGRFDNGVLLVRLVELLGGGPVGRSPVLFDDYVFGGWRAPSPVALAFSPRLRVWTLTLLLTVALFLWRALGAREFPRDPEPLSQAAPLARVTGAASLLLRAGRFGSLAQALRRGVFRRVAARARVHEDAERDAAGRAPGPEEVQRLVRAIGLEDTRVTAWKSAFLGPDPEGSEELEQLAQRLATLEREVGLGWNARGGADWKTHEKMVQETPSPPGSRAKA